MPVIQLSAGTIQRATCPPGRKKIEYRDTTIIGFSLECRAGGGKTYYLRYFDKNGRQRQFKIGGVNDITFDQARKRAKTLRADAVLGGDPAAAKEERKAVPTYSWLADEHLAHAKTYQKSYSSTEIIMRVHIRPRWDKVLVSDIKPQMVAKWLAEKAEEGLKPATVEKIRIVLNRSFNLALEWNVPGIVRNPVTTVPRRPFTNARDRALTATEAMRLRAAVAKSSNTQLKHIVGLLMLTGARVSELLQARWEHVDVERKTWLVPMSKNGRARRIPLSKPARDLIEKLPRFDKCAYLVPNPETLKPFVSIKHSWQTARKEAKLDDLHLHDLRHAFASAAVSAGVDLYAVGRILGHTDHKSTMRYAHLANETLLRAVEAGASNLSFGWGQPE